MFVYIVVVFYWWNMFFREFDFYSVDPGLLLHF